MKFLATLVPLLSIVAALQIESNIKDDEKVIPPGFTSFPLINYANGSFLLAANFSVGSPSAVVPFQFVSTDPNIVFSNVTPPYDNFTSPRYVSTGLSAIATVVDPVFDYYNVPGTLSYEYFEFHTLMDAGQGFLLGDINITISRLGFSFNQTNNNSLGFPIFMDKLWQQAQIGNRVLAFSTNFSVTGAPFIGTGYIGTINEKEFIGPLTNYSVSIDNGQWSFQLTDMAFGDLGLGYNGYVTINTNSPFHVVPMPVFQSLLSLINTSYVPLNPGNVHLAYFSTCPDLSTLPAISFNLNDQPLYLAPTQYVFDYGNFCLFAFAGSTNVPPIRAAFTLGTGLMNGTYTVFDFDHMTFGIAPLVPNGGAKA